MATKKAAGGTRLGRDSQPKYLGTKVGDGQTVRAGAILVRQRGTPIRAGRNVRRGTDDTLYAVTAGRVSFQKKQVSGFDGNLKKRTFVHVLGIK